jgi:hypothetical protein
MRSALVLGGILFATPCFADEAIPVMSFAKPTSSGKYVLVMPHSFEGATGKGLKEKYGRSGLYPTNDPTKPVWTCEWKADRPENVFTSADGVFAVRAPDGDPGGRHWRLMNDERVPPKRVGWEGEPALVIYQHGKPFRTRSARRFRLLAVHRPRLLHGSGRDHRLVPRCRRPRQHLERGEREAANGDDRLPHRDRDRRERGKAVCPFDFGRWGESGGEPANERNWIWALLIGLAVVGAVGLLVWNRRVRKE